MSVSTRKHTDAVLQESLRPECTTGSLAQQFDRREAYHQPDAYPIPKNIFLNEN